MSPDVIAKWRRLTPGARDVLARIEGREPLATNLRRARENRGLSQGTVAKKLRISRSLIAQIELANRPVSAEELAKLADLYGTSAVELTGTPINANDPVTATLLNLAPALLKEFDIDSRIHGVLGAVMEVSELETLLERPARAGRPTYSLPSPRTLTDAIQQGEQIAQHERQRLGFRNAPLRDMAGLCIAQGIPVFALKLPDDMSNLFIAHASVGFAIVVNRAHDAVRQRLAIAHGYAHSVFEPMGTIRACTIANEKELIERRADAFAGAFLLPGWAIDESVRSLGKGQGSRQVQWLSDRSGTKPVRAEERSAPGSQTFTYLDIAEIARRFGTGYRLTVSRLLGAGALSEPDSGRLLRPRFIALADEWQRIFGAQPPAAEPSQQVVVPGDAFASDVGTAITYMALEAFRRGLLTKADLADRVLTLGIPALSDVQLAAFAEALR